jgi:hypothetical protein
LKKAASASFAPVSVLQLQLLVDARGFHLAARPHAAPSGAKLALVSERRRFVHGIADR